MSAVPTISSRAYFLGIEDPWRFVRHALNDELRSRGATLPPDRYEEAVSFLMERLCVLATRWNPAAGSLSFSTFAYRILRRRYTDFLREWRGDARYGTWSGGDSHCRHTLIRDQTTGRVTEPQRCECGALRVGNDGREQTVAELPVPTGPLHHDALDADSFQALIDQLDHSKLSQRARGALTELFRRMAEDGLSATEAASRLGKSRREAQRDLDRLREELRDMVAA